jgi:MerC mercury resistance protein
MLTLLETITVMPPSAEAFSSLRTTLAATRFPATTTKTTTTATLSTTTTTTTALGLRQRRMGSRKLRILPPPSLQRRFGNENSKICPNIFCLDCPPLADDLLVCSVISTSGPASSSSSDNEGEIFFDAAASKSQRKPLSWFRSNTASVATTASISWKDKLLKVSNFASALCVIDCTVLPLVTIVLPLFGIVAASPAQMHYLHELGHQVALWFVMPVGTLATTLNYSNHGKFWISSLGWIGLVAILLANGGCHLFPHFHGPIGHALHELTHLLHHGIMHRVTNLAGCFLLLFSNYLSRRQKGGGSCLDPTCGRQH